MLRLFQFPTPLRIVVPIWCIFLLVTTINIIDIVNGDSGALLDQRVLSPFKSIEVADREWNGGQYGDRMRAKRSVVCNNFLLFLFSKKQKIGNF